MAKRYIETGFYKSPYVRGLKGSLKALYSFIICDSDAAGIWVKDLVIASAYIGFEVTEKDFQIFIKDGKAWDLKNGKFFFPDFIEHQYPNGLKEENPALKKTIKELLKYNLIDQNLKVVQRPSEGSNKDPHVIVTVTEDVKEGVKEKVKPREKNLELILPYDHPAFITSWETLLTQKKWKNKSQVALQASLKKLAGREVAEAIQMIENTIAGEWQGIFELKPGDRASPKKGTIDQYRAVSAKQDDEIMQIHGKK